MKGTNFYKDINYQSLLKERLDNLNSPVSILKIELKVKNLPLEKTLGQVGFTSEFCLTYKKEMLSVLPILF